MEKFDKSKKHQVVDTSKTRTMRTFNTILITVICILAVLIIIGTVIGLVRGKDSPLVKIGGEKAAQAEERSALNDDIRVFSGIGRLRIPLINSSVMILSIAFPYKADDIAFTEELAGKINEFKTIAVDYFTSLPETEIIQFNEETAKNEILNRYNGILRLGRISSLYFNDLMVLDAY